MRHDGILLIADDSPDIVHRLRTGLAEHGFTVRKMETSEKQEPASNPEANVDSSIVNLIDTGGTVVDELEDWMTHRNGGLTGCSIIIARHDLPADPNADPFSAPEVTGCIFKPFVPEDYIDRMIAERS